MTKKIEISSLLKTEIVSGLLYAFTDGNSVAGNGPCQLYLMGGDVPWDENGFYPKNLGVHLPAVGDWHPYYYNQDQSNGQISSIVSGTYTASVTADGQTIIASVTVADNVTTDFQIISRTGNNGFAFNNLMIPFQIPVEVVDFQSGGTGSSTVNIYAVTPSIGLSNALVQWKNNRIKANYSTDSSNFYIENSFNLSTYAAPALLSGTATWFYGRRIYNNNYGPDAIYGDMFIMGSVGLTGSGADLELDDVNIVQGKTYGISNLRIQVPTSFTY